MNEKAHTAVPFALKSRPLLLGYEVTFERNDASKSIEDLDTVRKAEVKIDQALFRFEKSFPGKFQFPNVIPDESSLHGQVENYSCFVISEKTVFLSYDVIYLVRFGSSNIDFAASVEDLKVLGIPEYTIVFPRISAIENFNHPQFRMKLEIYDKFRNELKLTPITGHSYLSDGVNLLVTPVIHSLIERIRKHDALRTMETYQTNAILQKREYSEIRTIANQAGAQLDTFVAANNLVFLEALPYVVGHDILNQPVLAPVLPWPEHELDFDFQNILARNTDESLPAHINIRRNSDGGRTRVVFSQRAWEEYQTIKRLNRVGGTELADCVASPGDYFSSPPRVPLEDTFSSRVVGFLIGKQTSNGDRGESGQAWSAGFEENSLLIRNSLGAVLHLDTTATPLEYEFLHRACLQFKTDEVAQFSNSKLAPGFNYTPLPVSFERLVPVPELKSEFSLTELLNVCRVIEIKNTPHLNPEEFEAAREKIKHAQSNGAHLVLWTSASGDEKSIPLVSLKNALPPDEKHSEQMHVAPVLEEVNSDCGSAPNWHWSNRKISEQEGLIHFKSGISLHHHQEIGYSWLCWLQDHKSDLDLKNRQHKGAFLADDMGLGKTIQVLAMATRTLKLDEDKLPILIVAPASLINDAWKTDAIKAFLTDDFASFADFKDCPYKIDSRLLAVEAGKVNEEMGAEGKAFHLCAISQSLKNQLSCIQEWARGKVIFCTYEALRLNSIVLASLKFAVVILDEAQKIKNVGVLQSDAAKALNAEFYVAMSGTPIENSLMDLWSIMDFVRPGHLGSQVAFRSRFIEAIQKTEPGSDRRAALRGELEAALQPVWLRRTKEEVFRNTNEMPKIYHYDSIANTDGSVSNVHSVRMSDSQKNMYSDQMGIYNAVSNGHRLATIRMLMEICSSPWLALPMEATWENREKLFEICPKLEITFHILQQIDSDLESCGKKVIVFANTIQLQSSLAYLIANWQRVEKGRKMEVEVFNGNSSFSERSKMLQRFKDAAGLQVIVISPRSGGAGLNITEANHVIHYTREWNPALENQATARAYRIGQKREVHVYYPTTVSGDASIPSAEEHLAEILRSKRNVMDDFTVSFGEVSASENTFSILEKSHQEGKNSFLTLEKIKGLDDKAFEHLICAIYKSQGYDSKVIGGPGDGGADVVAFSENKNFLIQVKHTQANIPQHTAGILEVRGAHTNYEARYKKKFELVVVTNGKFSEKAILLALEGTRVQLFENDWIVKCLSENPIKLRDIFP
jgi:SNF2 family DNA or RNA helicase